ncbi:hypothetical protein ACSYAD_35190 [Acaryochloris marina NIES-2412]|uniref:hypothetical protein n=1 Tax=Acaryochloris marina TaxID=155978 RepID=UPI00405968E3
MQQDIKKDIAFLKEMKTYAIQGFNGDWSSRDHVLGMIEHWIHELEGLREKA